MDKETCRREDESCSEDEEEGGSKAKSFDTKPPAVLSPIDGRLPDYKDQVRTTPEAKAHNRAQNIAALKSNRAGAGPSNKDQVRGNQVRAFHERPDISEEQYDEESAAPGADSVHDISHGIRHPFVQAELAPNLDEIVAEALRTREQEMSYVSAEVVESPANSGLNILLPAFPPEVEKRFQTEHAELVRPMVRLLLLPCTFLYIFFFLWDLAQEDADIITSLIIRCGVQLQAVAFFAFTFSKRFLSWGQAATCTLITVGAIGVALILFLFQDGFILGVAGICLCHTAGSSFLMLQFRYSFLSAILILAVTNILIVFDESAYDLQFVLINTNFFLVSYLGFGLITSYAAELHLRQRFRDTGTLFRWTRSEASPERGMRLFFSYRRLGASGIVQRMEDQLQSVLGHDVLIKDIDATELGSDYRLYLGRRIRRCKLLLAVVGQIWCNAEGHSASILDDNDAIRTEIEIAMNLNVPILPVLVEGAHMPEPDELPDSIRGFANFNPTIVREDPFFGSDMDLLVQHLNNTIGEE